MMDTKQLFLLLAFKLHRQTEFELQSLISYLFTLTMQLTASISKKWTKIAFTHKFLLISLQIHMKKIKNIVRKKNFTMKWRTRSNFFYF